MRSRSALPLAGPSASRYLSRLHAGWLVDDPSRSSQVLDATLLFADVSGFTALGERLSRSGRVGTEELTDVVKRVFARMLEPVLELGGDLLKFGGDAVLIAFDGDGHAERAAAAALAMQESIRSLRGMRTSAGAVSLRLSAGLASGDLHLFISGSRFCELVAAGPLVSEVCTLEGEAGPGEVMISPVTAELLGVRRRPADGRSGIPIRSAPPVYAFSPPVAVPGDPALGLPAHLHHHEPAEGEHRMVTAAFIQFRGTDDLLARGGSDALADALDELSSAVQDACHGYGVTLVTTDVDRNAGKFYLVTGAPTTALDDEDRMLHAVRSVVTREWALPVRGGVNRGRAFVVDVGPAGRLSWSVMGDTVNLAARVMGKAPDGGVLATASVLERARDPFERTPVEPFMAKGKRLPVHAEVVGPVKGTMRAPRSGTQPLVGREEELRTLRRALTLARSGSRVVVQLTGEAGMGKTRLLDAALEDVDDFRAVTVQGGPYGAASPYLALRGPLRALIGAAHDDPESEVAARLRQTAERFAPKVLPWLPLIAMPFGVELPPTPASKRLSPEFARARLHAATTDLLDAMPPGGPLLLTIEDAHWLDEASSDLLTHLVRRLRRSHRATMVTRRSVPGGLDVSGIPGVVDLEITPLGDQASVDLLHEVGPALTPRARAELIERAAGNPLFLQELVAAAQEAGGDVSELPDTVEALLTARIDTLAPAARTLLRRASVLGLRIDVPVLGAMVELDEGPLETAIGELDPFLMRVGPGVVRFRHALARDAAYEALPFRVRRSLHGRAAELLETRAPDPDDVAELLAIHYHAAGRWAASWRWSRTAGEQATRQSAPVEAVGFLAAALVAGRHLDAAGTEELASVAEALGDAALLCARYQQGADAYAAARRHAAGDVLRLAEVCRKEGRLRERSQNYAQAKRWYTRAARLLGDDLRPEAVGLRARITCARGAAELRQGRLRAAVPLLLEAVTGAAETGDRPTLAHAYYLLDWAYTDLGSPEATRYRDLALPIYEELEDQIGQGNVLNNLGIAAYYEGRWEDAVALYERSRDAFERGGDVVQVATALNNVGEIRSDQGRLTEAEALLAEAHETWQAAGFPAGAGWARSNLGRVAARRGELERARELLADAREQLAAIGAAALALEVDAREAERRLLAADHEGALELINAVAAGSAQLGAGHALSAMVHRIAGSALLLAGRRDEGLARLREAVRFAHEVGAPYEEALALEALASSGEPEDAANRSAAGVIFTGLGVGRATEPAEEPPVRTRRFAR